MPLAAGKGSRPSVQASVTRRLPTRMFTEHGKSGRKDLAPSTPAEAAQQRFARVQKLSCLNGPANVNRFRSALADDFEMIRPFEDLRVGKEGFVGMIAKLRESFPDLSYHWLTSGAENSLGLVPATIVIRGTHTGNEYAPFGIGLLALPAADRPRSFEVLCSALLRFDSAGHLQELQSLSDATTGGAWAIYEQLGADPEARLVRLVKQAWGNWHLDTFEKYLHEDFKFLSGHEELDRAGYIDRVQSLKRYMPDVHAEGFEGASCRLLPSGALQTAFEIVGHHSGEAYADPTAPNLPSIQPSNNKVRLTKRVLLTWQDGFVHRMVDAGSEPLHRALERAAMFEEGVQTVTESWDEWSAGQFTW